MSDLFETREHGTPISEEEKRDLIPSLSTRAELNEAERANILEARLWAMHGRTLKRADLITDGFARELHRKMFYHVWKWAGCYRNTERNLGWEAHRLGEGVHNVFADARAWLEYKTYPLPEAAVRLHHQLVRIHPWPNGNGRHARLIADVVVQSRGGEDLTWGAGIDIADMGVARAKYIEALRHADAGNYDPLIKFAKS